MKALTQRLFSIWLGTKTDDFGAFAFFVFSSLRYFRTATLGRKRNSGTFSTVSQLVENYFFDKLKLETAVSGLFFCINEQSIKTADKSRR